MAELQTGPRYLCLRRHNSRRTCFGSNICPPPPALCQISLGYTDDPYSQPGSGCEVFSSIWWWRWEGEHQQELMVGGGVRGVPGGLQWGSGWCWAGPVVAEGAAGVQVQASGLGLECNREFPVS